MPPPPLFNLDGIDQDRVLIPREEIYARYLPHRHEFMLLDGISFWDAENARIVSFVDIRETDWWVRGHLPGRSLLPGVLMLEMAAQTSSVGVTLLDEHRKAPRKGFVGFGGVEECKFRDALTPPARLNILCLGLENRSRRFVSAVQGWSRGDLVFEAKIAGLVMGTRAETHDPGRTR